MQSKKKFLTPDLVQDLEKIVKLYERKQAALLPVLHRLQDAVGWIPEESEAEVAAFLGIPEVGVHEVVTFYEMFHQKKTGKYHIKVCQTLSCHLNGGPSLLEHLKKKLNLEVGGTTTDFKFTLSTVECLGACEIAPVIQINKDYHGNLTPEKVDEILDGLS
jgi:NADH-quinone oxidoreductase E subunit